MPILIKPQISPILLYVLFSSLFWRTVSDNYYKAGMSYINQGEFEKGIDKWIEARETLQTEGKADFRIGVKFIEYVTEREAEHLYPLASEMYYWGLNSNSVDYCFDYLEKELDMLEPIVADSTFSEWLELLENGNPKIFSSLKQFWVSKDPSITTPMNERLIEHWERIAFARENFNKTNSTVYGTDDRGLIYVKYGEPDRLDSGTFTLNPGRVQQWISETIEHQDRRMENYDPSLFVDNVISNSDNFASNEIYKQNLSKRLADKFISDFGHVEYVTWIYDKEHVETSQSLIFFFGKLGQSKPFGLVDGPEELITHRSFRERNIGGTRFQYNFGPISQLSFYDNLKFVDDYFLDTFHEMQDNLFNNPEITQESSSEYLRNRYINHMNSIRSSANQSLSIYDRETLSFNVLHKQARFLDDNNEPYEVNIIYSEPHDAIFSDYNHFTSQYADFGEPEYRVQHSFTLFDSDYNPINAANDFPDVTFERFDFTDGYIRPVSIFRHPITDDGSNNRIEVRIFNISYGEQTPKTYRSDFNRLPEELIGAVNHEITSKSQTEPLNNNSLELSDIILCFDYESLEETGFETAMDTKELFFPCYVPYEMKIPSTQDLNFYFEIYNLETNDQNQANFTIDYQTQALEQSQGFFSRLFGRTGDENPTSITLSYEISSDRMKDHLKVDLSDYIPGTYELTLTIKDDNSESVVSRSKEFEVLDE